MQMNKNGHTPPRRRLDYAAAAVEQMNQYCVAHPGSPSAVRRPRLFVRGELWIALLGPSVEEGIVGIGATIAAALRAFDAQYSAGLPAPIAAAGKIVARRRPSRNAKSGPKYGADGLVLPSHHDDFPKR
jgi:hypothetical protein